MERGHLQISFLHPSPVLATTPSHGELSLRSSTGRDVSILRAPVVPGEPFLCPPWHTPPAPHRGLLCPRNRWLAPSPNPAFPATARTAFLTVKDAAEYLGLSPHTLYVWRHRRQGPPSFRRGPVVASCTGVQRSTPGSVSRSRPTRGPTRPLTLSTPVPMSGPAVSRVPDAPGIVGHRSNSSSRRYTWPAA
ncbi:helix-turn-helix domain-containing protein [Streptomyces ipomoeae]|nr:helix-turn-helix domain-containing protein [Streptomyces ipomoeae]MDX2937191.1 helix-turn-helix domain-containing protein [Streptomyces ipomoeae]